MAYELDLDLPAGEALRRVIAEELGGEGIKIAESDRSWWQSRGSIGF